MADEQGKALGWNDTVEHDGGDWTLLPEGVYPFRVVSFERAHWGGSAKMPPCPQAKITIEVGDEEQSTTIVHNLFLHTKTEGLLCDFFKGIGARKHGERMVMDWSKVVGATGRCRVAVRKWNGKDNSAHESNEIKKFIDPTDAAVAASEQAAPPQKEMPF